MGPDQFEGGGDERRGLYSCLWTSQAVMRHLPPIAKQFVLRLLCCAAAGGVLSFCRNPANVIDLVAIMPWYIDRVGLEGPGFLSLLRIIRITRIARIFKMSKNMQVHRGRVG